MALIVVAEDDAGTMRLIEAALHLQGHEVLTANNGQSAWMTIRQYRPDLVVSDINMPGVNGFDLLKAVREHAALQQTPFILLTSLQERRNMRQGMTLGADDYLTKPVHPRELVDAVAAQLNRKAMRTAALELLWPAVFSVGSRPRLHSRSGCARSSGFLRFSPISGCKLALTCSMM